MYCKYFANIQYAEIDSRELLSRRGGDTEYYP